LASDASTPSPALNFTGERFAPEVRGAIWYEHWHRYCVAQPLARGLRVLDAACGEGYGSYLLARSASEVTGVDVSAEAIAHARARYAAPNLRYVQGSVTALPLADACIDLVVSFETIEHLVAQAEMLAEFRRVLVPGGALIISSPNRPVYSGELPQDNEYHVRELDRGELAAVLTSSFPQQRWYAQRVVAQSLIWAESCPAGTVRDLRLTTLAGDEVAAASVPAPPMYFLVVCGAPTATLPSLPDLALFDDGRQSLYRDYQRALLREKQLYWDEFDARQVAEGRLAEAIAFANELAGKRAELDAARRDAASYKQALDEAAARLSALQTWRGWLRWPVGRIRRALRGKS
jgi:SAM-dependent methyltransferase